MTNPLVPPSYFQMRSEDCEGPPIRMSAEQLGTEGIEIGVEGHGMCAMDDDFDKIVMVVNVQGLPRVLVWADINSKEPTHCIDLSGAQLGKRRPIKPLLAVPEPMGRDKNRA